MKYKLKRIDLKPKIVSADFVRGLAVVFVATYHFFPALLSNGWIGVDLFFVLSGFLLYEKANTQSFKSFLLRRAYRIVVPLVIFCLVVVPFCLLLFKSAYWMDVLILPSLSAFVGVANLYFFQFQDYFNKLTYQPFLHFWSLGPEMQFLLIIAVLNLTKRSSFHWIAVIVALGSFFANVLVEDHAVQFYLTPFRLYEFFAGGLASMIYRRQLNEKLPGVVGLIQFIAILGFFALATGVIGETRFEASNLALIFAFVFLVGTGREKHWGRLSVYLSMLASRSYSIYLVHYPFAFFAKTLALDALEKFLIVALSLLFSEIFYRLVDRKVMDRGFDISVSKLLLILGVFGVYFILTLTLTDEKNLPSAKVDNNYGNRESVRIVALGDSHISHARLFLDEIDIAVDYVPVNCLPVPNTTHIYAVTDFSQKNEKCVDQNRMWDEKYHSYDFILLAARWSHPFIGEIDANRVFNQWSYETRLISSNSTFFKDTNISESKRIFEIEMELLAQKIVKQGKTLILFGEVPPLGATPTGCERLNDFFKDHCNRNYFTSVEALNRLSYTSEFFEKLSQKYGDNVIYLDVAKVFCAGSRNFCMNWSGSTFLYSDDNHLNFEVLIDNKKFFEQTKNIVQVLKHIFEKFQ